jgi:two-component system NtrC family response regulator
MTKLTGHILLVDDEAAFQRLGSAWLQGLGHQVTVAGDVESAVAKFRDGRPDVVLLDLVMPPSLRPEAGLELIADFASAPVIVITAHADHEIALRATECGAWDFIAKPIDPDLLRFIIDRALQKVSLQKELVALREAPPKDDLGIVGHSEAVRRMRDLIRRLAPTNLSVMILGPTGTGKELVARALHNTGPRRNAPFIPIHCGAVPAELQESELFGHLKGSFTGAHRDQHGLIAAAHKGTLFLDEIGEMPLSMQVKLLRFLQEGTYLPVGGRDYRSADVRVVAATHRDLEAMVAEGGFREDLYYRLKGMVLRTPALAERREDIPLLAASFLRRANGKRRFRLTPDAVQWLIGHEWRGNVRELQSLMDCVAALAEPENGNAAQIDIDLLRFAEGNPDAPKLPGKRRGLDEEIATLETRMISEALAETGNNRSEAARLLGISRVGLLKKMDRLALR